MNLVDEIYAVLVERFGVSEICVKKYGKRAETTWKEFISIVIAPGYLDANPLANRLGFADKSGLSRYLNKEYKEICRDKVSGLKWHIYFLSFINLKVCIDCGEILPYSEYVTDNTTYSKLKNTCINCSSVRGKKYRDNNQEHLIKYREDTKEHKREYCKKYSIANKDSINEYSRKHYQNNKYLYVAKSAKRRAIKLQATPKWADLEAIKEVYKNCPEGSHVDHWAPLQGELVCGLHVHKNLQYLTAAENLAKSNKFTPC